MAVIDELAGAGELVKGKCDQVPVAVVRGYPGAGTAPGAGAVALLRDAASDMFSLGTAEARAAGLRDAAALPDGPAVASPAAEGPIARALETVAGSLAEGTAVEPTSAGLLRCTPPEATPAALMRLGADVHRLRVALAAEGLSSTVTYADVTAIVAVSAP
jgi:coenzyme F420-0:L-glutamate ligase/coenzyme F420-1:gamma-L-glutamate ligase